MSLLKHLPAFVATAFLLAMVPGQGVAMVLRQSIVGGKRAAIFSVLGNSSGLVIWASLSSLGLSAIFAASHTAYNILKWCGVIFLVGLSLQTLFELRKSAGKFEFDGQVKTNLAGAYRTGLFTNLTNVKAAVFAVAFIPQFVPKGFNLGLGIFLLGWAWAATSSTWYLILISIVDKSSTFLARPKVRRALTALSAVGIIALAIGLATTAPK